MAYGKLIFENVSTGEQKIAPVGFSWTTFFFGIFPALFRLDWINFAIQAGVHLFIALVSGGLLNFFVTIVFAAIYNKMYIKSLIESNWRILRCEGDKSLVDVSADIGLDLSRFMKPTT